MQSTKIEHTRSDGAKQRSRSLRLYGLPSWLVAAIQLFRFAAPSELQLAWKYTQEREAVPTRWWT